MLHYIQIKSAFSRVIRRYVWDGRVGGVGEGDKESSRGKGQEKQGKESRENR